METQALTMHTPLPVLPAPRRRPALPLTPLRDAQALCDACAPAALPATAAAAWAGLAVTREVPAGALVLTRHAPATSLWLVTRGRVALGTLGEDGQLQHRRSVEAGQWLDLASALLGRGHLEDAVAELDGEVWQLPLQDVLRAGQSHPAILAALATASAAQVQGLIEGTRSLVMKDVQSRCASWLLDHAARGDDGPQRSLKLHQRKRAIAQQLGTTAETFSRTLRQLTRRGLIEVRGYTITLLDLDGLRSLAEPAGRHDRRPGASGTAASTS